MWLVMFRIFSLNLLSFMYISQMIYGMGGLNRWVYSQPKIYLLLLNYLYVFVSLTSSTCVNVTEYSDFPSTSMGTLKVWTKYLYNVSEIIYGIRNSFKESVVVNYTK